MTERRESSAQRLDLKPLIAVFLTALILSGCSRPKYKTLVEYEYVPGYNTTYFFPVNSGGRVNLIPISHYEQPTYKLRYVIELENGKTQSYSVTVDEHTFEMNEQHYKELIGVREEVVHVRTH